MVLELEVLTNYYVLNPSKTQLLHYLRCIVKNDRYCVCVVCGYMHFNVVMLWLSVTLKCFEEPNKKSNFS